jgi:hypothetical protein
VRDAEAYALMTSGYKITAAEFERTIRDFPTKLVVIDRRFLYVEPLMRSDAENDEPEALLRLSRERFFNLLRLSPFARAGPILVLVVAVLAPVYAFCAWRDQTLLPAGILGGTVVAYALLPFVSKRLVRLRFRETVARAGIELGVALVAPIAFGMHPLFVNRHYLDRGRVTRHADGTGTVGTVRVSPGANDP